MKDRIGRWTQRSYNSMDQLSFEIDPLGRKTQYSWCDCGAIGSITDPAGRTTTWSHDLEGRILTKTYADTTTCTYTYDTIGRNSTRLDALNQTTTYTYNIDNTISQIAYTNTVNPTSTCNYTYDPNYMRLSTAQNNWGTVTYNYNAYITDPYATPITGGGRISSITNNVISNSNVSYTYDAIGRTTNRSINSSSNSTTWTYDAISRITQEVNPLGTFGYTYVDNTPGSSKGVYRLASVSYPNSQTTNYSWYGNTGDQRLQQISNLNPSSATLSQFNYTYDAAGEITQWQRQQNSSNFYDGFGYDLAGQLVTAETGSGIAGPPYCNELYYKYNNASCRSDFEKTSGQTARLGGTITSGDVITITFTDPNLSGGSHAVSYTVTGTDTLTSIATNLATAITADTTLGSLGVNATSSANVVNIKSLSPSITTYSSSVSGSATETVAFNTVMNGTENISIGGTKTTGDTLTLTVTDAGLSGGTESVTYTVLSTDTLTTITTGLTAAINADTHLQGIGVTASSAGTVIGVKSNSVNATTYTTSTSGGATETMALSVNYNGIETVNITGSKTTGNILTITVYDSTLTGGSKAVTYTVLSGDTLTSIAAGIATAINADTNLQAIGVTATSSSAVVFIKSISLNNTTYAQSTSGGATEVLTLGLSTITFAHANNTVNELTGITAGTWTRYQGTTNKAVKSVTIDSAYPATLNWSENFTGNAQLAVGPNNTTVAAVDGANNTVTNNYQVNLNNASSKSYTWDANGNMTGDGVNTFQWDAENRLIQKNYPGTNNYTKYTYDALSEWANIQETSAGTVTSTKQFVWAGGVAPVEARDASSAITAQYFSLGETISGTNYYYTKDHLGSIREMTNSYGAVVGQYNYDPFGQVTKIQGSQNSDFQYAGYYYHAPSGLNLTQNRAYNASLGRWISRDPIGENGGINLYAYVNNEPINFSDPRGLQNCQNRKGFPFSYPAALYRNWQLWPIWLYPKPVPPGWDGNNPPRYPEDFPPIENPEPYIWPGSPPWDSKRTAPYRYIA